MRIVPSRPAIPAVSDDTARRVRRLLDCLRVHSDPVDFDFTRLRPADYAAFQIAEANGLVELHWQDSARWFSVSLTGGMF